MTNATAPNIKHFTDSDVHPHGVIAGAGSLSIEDYHLNLLESPLWFHRRNLSQTVSGYGARLTTSKKIHFNNRFYRIYCTQYGNAGSCWFKAKGKKIFVN